MADDRSHRGRVGELTRDGAVVLADHLEGDECERLAAVARDLLEADLPVVDPTGHDGPGTDSNGHDGPGTDSTDADRPAVDGSGDDRRERSSDDRPDGKRPIGIARRGEPGEAADPDPEPSRSDPGANRTGPETARIHGDPEGPGIVTIAHADQESEDLADLRDDFVLETLVNGYTERFYAATSLSVRIACGPTDPAPYHVPGEDLFLGVVYLTDCTSVADGPYAYIHGSQNESSLKRRLGSTLRSITDRGTGEAAFYEAGDGTAHTGPAGTAVVANGRGYQRFLPTAESHESVVAVITFEPVRVPSGEGPEMPGSEEWE